MWCSWHLTVLSFSEVACCFPYRTKLGNDQTESVFISQLTQGVALEFEGSDAARKLRIVLSELLFIMCQACNFFDCWLVGCVVRICKVIWIMKLILQICELIHWFCHHRFVVTHRWKNQDQNSTGNHLNCLKVKFMLKRCQMFCVSLKQVCVVGGLWRDDWWMLFYDQ